MATTKEDKEEGSGKASKRASRKGKGKEKDPAANPSGQSEAAGPSTSSEGIAPWKWNYLADPQASKQPAVFTKDARFFFVAISSAVKIYSTETGKIVSTLQSHSPGVNGYSDRITCLRINPLNSFQLLTGSADGLLRVWDFIDGMLLQAIDVGHPISHLCAHRAIEDYVFVVCQKQAKTNSRDDPAQTSIVLRVSLTPTNATVRSSVKKSKEVAHVGKVRSAVGMAVSASGRWLVVAGGTKVYVASTSKLKAGFTKYVCPEKLTCVALHPSEDWVATGDQVGQIRLWYCLQDESSAEKVGEDRTAPTTTLHWHAHGIQAIEFTPNGAYLLSGGEESVLVIWQLHSGKKEFVPRVGAPIQTISVCDSGDGTREQEYLLGLQDGTLAFVGSATLKLSRVIARMKLESSYVYAGATPPLFMQPKSQRLILPSSHPSSLQIYSTTSTSLYAELEVSPSNRVSRPFRKPLKPSRVDHAATSDCEQWLATVDTRDGSDQGFGLEVFLKIWEFDEMEGTWSLHTKLDRPHGMKRINSISFRPSSLAGELLLVTTGDDSYVKTWSLRAETEKGSELSSVWVLRTSFTYRNQIPNQATWSSDGSILAVAHGAFVSLWSVESNALSRLFIASEISNFLKVAFIGRNGRFLCAIGHRGLAVFDLIKGEAAYVIRTPNPIIALLAWPGQDEFVTAHDPSIGPNSTPGSISTLFCGRTPRFRETIFNRTVPFRIKKSIPWQSAQNPQVHRPAIVGITQEGALIHVSDNSLSRTEEGDIARSLGQASIQSERPALFQDIFGKSAILDIAGPGKAPAASAFRFDQNQLDFSILDGPSHLLPPVRTMFSSLMQGMLRQPPAAGVAKEATVVKDDDMVIDSHEISQPVTTTPNGRIVTTKEIELFVDLFRSPEFIVPRPTLEEPPKLAAKARPRIPSLTNGKAKANGVHHMKGSPTGPAPQPTIASHILPNGAASHKRSKSNPLVRVPSPPPREPSPTIGKKRKNAMMA